MADCASSWLACRLSHAHHDQVQSTSPDESNNADHYSDEQWGDAWAGEEQQEQASSPAQNVAQEPAQKAVEARDDLTSAPKGLGEFKAARRRAGKAEKLPQTPKPQRVPRKQKAMEALALDRQAIEEKDWGAPTAFDPKWTTFITLAILGMIIACLALMQLSGPATQEGSDITGKEQRKEMLEAELHRLTSREQEARKMYADFASARVVEEILPMIRNSKELGDLIRRIGHDSTVGSDWRPPADADWRAGLFGNRLFAVLSGDMPDFSNFSAYFVLEGDLLLLDWKATTAYSSTSFDELVQGKGDGSEIRGYLKPAEFYYGDFTKDQYHCYQLESPDRREVVWCYVKRSSELAIELGRYFLKGEIIEESTDELPMTLKLSRMEGRSMPNQWLLDGLLYKNWIPTP